MISLKIKVSLNDEITIKTKLLFKTFKLFINLITF